MSLSRELDSLFGGEVGKPSGRIGRCKPGGSMKRLTGLRWAIRDFKAGARVRFLRHTRAGVRPGEPQATGEEKCG